MRKNSGFLFVIAATLLIAAPAGAQYRTTGTTGYDYGSDYIAFKGGMYSPSDDFDIDNINAGTTSRISTDTGFSGEIAFGHYYSPAFAMEFGAGYFENKGEAALGSTKVKTVPLLITAKFGLPMSVVEPFAEAGVGAYFSKLDVAGTIGTSGSSTEITAGVHAGVGLNFNFSDSFFLGVEGRYLWLEPSFDGQEIELNGFTTTLNLGFSY